MNYSKKWYILLASLFTILLAACTSSTDAITEPSTPTAPSTDVTQDDPNSDIVTLYVGSETVNCVGEAPQSCLEVKETSEGEYELFYDSIAGFTFESGYEYELKVLVEPVENPAADASSLRYTLVEEVSKDPVDSTDTSDSETSNSVPLNGTAWVLDTYTNSRGDATNILPDTEITIHFENGGLQGNASCNQYFSDYELKGNNITINIIGSTEMFCGPGDAIMAQESDYLTALSQVSQYQSDNNQLILTDEKGEFVLTYSPQTSTTLADMMWQAVGYDNGKGGIVSILAETEITANFGQDGTLSGSAGCNAYNTTYETNGNSIKISDQIALTRRACTPEQSEQEQAYVAALQKVTTYHIEGDRLELHDADGALLADYTAVSQLDLSAATWQVTAYNSGGQATVSVMGGTQLTAQFNSEGMVNGQAGCNSYNGPYTTEGSSITIGPLISTKKACEADIMQQESAYLAALQAAATYQIQGETLQILMADGTLSASLQISD